MDRAMRFYTKKDLEVLNEVARIRDELAPQLPYHNAGHMKEVASMVERHALMEGLGYVEKRRLRKAAELHDIIYVPGRTDNEERAAELSRGILAGLGDSQEEQDEVARLILVTDLARYTAKWVEDSDDRAGMIIRDADIYNLGGPEFFEKTELLRQEEGVESREEWYKGALSFLEGAMYLTESARDARDEGLKENIERMREISGLFNKEDNYSL